MGTFDCIQKPFNLALNILCARHSNKQRSSLDFCRTQQADSIINQSERGCEMNIQGIKEKVLKEKYTIISVIALMLIISIAIYNHMDKKFPNPAVINLEDKGIPITEEQLFLHIEKNDPQVVEWLLLAGVNENAINTDGYTAIAAAANGENRADIIRILGKYRADPNLPSSEKNWPALFIAIGKDIENVKALLEIGAQVNYLDANNISPLYLATKSGSPDTINLLVQAGANVNLHNKGHVNIPLYEAVKYAVTEKNNTMVFLLLTYGADPFAVENTESGPRIPINIKGISGGLEEMLRHKMVEWNEKQQG